MSLYSKSRIAVGIFFILTVFVYGGVNLYMYGSDVLGLLRKIGESRSVEELRQSERRAVETLGSQYAGKFDAWAMHARVSALMGKTEMNNLSVMKSRSGRLFRGSLYDIPTNTALLIGKDIVQLSDAALEYELDIFYLGLPDSLVMGAERPLAYLPFRNFNGAIDSLFFRLREGGVRYLDTRYMFFEQGTDPESVTLKTAFKMTGAATLAVFDALLESLEKDYSFVLDPDGFYRNRDNYEITTHAGFFIGEMGKETGPAFSGLDDFTVITPKFETNFTIDAIETNGRAFSAQGEASETILDPKALLFYNNYYWFYPQSYYAHTNLAWSKTINTLRPDGPKVLLVHDFYSAEIAALLAPLCGELHTLASPQNQLESPMTMEQYISDNDLDFAIISFFPQNLANPEIRSLLLEKPDDPDKD